MPALSPGTTTFASGLIAGLTTTAVTHPLDLLKTRQQLHTTQTQAKLLLRTIYRAEGLPGIYRGVGPNLIGNGVSWGVYFFFYEDLKNRLRRRGGTLEGKDYMLASVLAGSATTVLTNPLWVLKTRMISSSRATPGAYGSVLAGVRSIWKDEGLRGFFRGVIPSLGGVLQAGLQFAFYERGKEILHAADNGLDTPRILFASLTAKVVSMTAVYPYQVVRTRLQSYQADELYRGVFGTIRMVLAREGFSGLWKGWQVAVFRTLPATGVMFVVFENTKVFLEQL